MSQALAPLRESLDPLLPIWLLVDPLLGEPLPVGEGASVEAAREQAWGRTVRAITLPARIDLPPHQHPYLVAIDGPDDPWLNGSWAMAEAERTAAWADGLAGAGRAAWRIGGWLQSPCSAETLTDALARLMTLRTKTATQARYLRVADRRTLDGLSLAVGVPRLAAALGPIRRWVWVDSCGAAAMLLNDGEGLPAGLTLDAREWAELQLADRVHPCLARWQGELEVERVMERTPRHEETLRTMARVRDAVMAAQQAARTWSGPAASADDVIAWAAMDLLHPGFQDHPATQGWLQARAQARTHPDSAEAPEPFNVHCHSLRALWTQGDDELHR